MDHRDWPGFLINLSSEIIGALIILILVDRRLRDRDVRLLRGFKATTAMTLRRMVSREMRHIVSYGRILDHQLEAIERPYYLPRPGLDHLLEEAKTMGFILTGASGSGKSVVLQRFTRHQVEDLLMRPGTSPIPVIVPSKNWKDPDVTEILKHTIQGYHNVPGRLIDKWLLRGRLMCIFDFVDELTVNPDLAGKIDDFRRSYPLNRVIVSTWPLRLKSDCLQGLNRIDVPAFTADEIRRIRQMRLRASA
ncbi:hypothetical protein JW906_13375 [bacterium]|nr:hypothetical protein [bacterium]